MRSKKFFALLLAVVMTIGCLAGCGTPGTGETEAPGSTEKKTEAQTDQPKETEAPAEKPTITIGIKANALTEDYETNDYTLWLEEQLGVNLDFELFSSDNTEATQQLSLMVSGNEKLPDILLGFSMGTDGLGEYGEDGYFIDLREYVENSVYLKENLEYMSEEKQNYFWIYGTNPTDGGFYALPSMEEQYVDSVTAFMFINQEWLDAVNKKAPTTVDELYDVLKAFKEAGDINGNGIADEIPAIGSNSGYRTDITEYIVNGFVRSHDIYIFNADNGELWVPYTTDEYREAMIYLNKLVSENLLSPMTFTMTDSHADLKKLVTPAEGGTTVGMFTGQPVLMCDESDALRQFVGLAPLQDETGKGGYGPLFDDTYVWQNVISADCENPDLAFKVLDFMYSPESYIRQRYGNEGEGWRYVENGVGMQNMPATFEILKDDAFGSQNNICWHTLYTVTLLLSSGEGKWTAIATEDDGGYYWYRNAVLWDMADKWRTGKPVEEQPHDLVWSADEKDTLGDTWGMVRSYVREARALFATGGLDPNSDSDWQTYLDTLEGKGMSLLLETAQQAYDRMQGK